MTRSSNSWARAISDASSSKARAIVGAVSASIRGQTDVAVTDSKNFRASGRGRFADRSPPGPAATTVARKSTLSTTSSSTSGCEK